MQEGCPHYSYYWRLLVENQTKYQQGPDCLICTCEPSSLPPSPADNSFGNLSMPPTKGSLQKITPVEYFSN
jgi:hypothetical protein